MSTILSEKTVMMMPYMIDQNWLLSYQTIEGIDNILTQMDSRTKNQSKMRFASEELREFYTEFEEDFTAFFEELRAHAQQKLIEK
jgi:acyl carrier protein phosphodiesterase